VNVHIGFPLTLLIFVLFRNNEKIGICTNFAHLRENMFDHDKNDVINLFSFPLAVIVSFVN
jgi:hypothetical protein